MAKHSHSRSHSHSQKVDYRDVLSQRSPEHQIAVVKLVAFTVLLTGVVAYLFTHA